MRRAEIGLIGLTPMERTVIACKLRRQGWSVHSELVNRKNNKMYKAAKEEAVRVFDLDKVEDQEELSFMIK